MITPLSLRNPNNCHTLLIESSGEEDLLLGDYCRTQPFRNSVEGFHTNICTSTNCYYIIDTVAQLIDWTFPPQSIHGRQSIKCRNRLNHAPLMAIMYVTELHWHVRHSLDGHTVVVPTVRWSVMQTKRSNWHGQERILQTTFQIASIQMRQLCRWRPMVNSAAPSLALNQGTSQDRNIQRRFKANGVCIFEGCLDAASTSWNKLHTKFDQVSFRSLCKVALNFIRVASDFIQNCFKHMKFDQVSFQSSCEVGPKFAHVLPRSSLRSVSTLFAPTVTTTTLHNWASISS